MARDLNKLRQAALESAKKQKSDPGKLAAKAVGNVLGRDTSHINPYEDKNEEKSTYNPLHFAAARSIGNVLGRDTSHINRLESEARYGAPVTPSETIAPIADVPSLSSAGKKPTLPNNMAVPDLSHTVSVASDAKDTADAPLRELARAALNKTRNNVYQAQSPARTGAVFGDDIDTGNVKRGNPALAKYNLSQMVESDDYDTSEIERVANIMSRYYRNAEPPEKDDWDYTKDPDYAGSVRESQDRIQGLTAARETYIAGKELKNFKPEYLTEEEKLEIAANLDPSLPNYEDVIAHLQSGEPIRRTEMYSADTPLFDDQLNDPWLTRNTREIQKEENELERRQNEQQEERWFAREGRRWDEVQAEVAASGFKYKASVPSMTEEELLESVINDRTGYPKLFDGSGFRMIRDAITGDDLMQYWTYDERNTYEYLLANGREEEAKEYKDYLAYDASARQAEDYVQMSNNVFGNMTASDGMLDDVPGIAASTFTYIVTSPLKAIGQADLYIQEWWNNSTLNTKGYKPVRARVGVAGTAMLNESRAINTQYFAELGTVNDVLRGITGNPDLTLHPLIGDRNLGDVYSGLVDRGVSAMNAYMFGNGKGSLTGMSLESGYDTFNENVANDVSRSRSLTAATPIGAMEAIGEQVGFDLFTDALGDAGTKSRWKSALGFVLAWAGDAAGEMTTEAGQQMFEIAILGDQSSWSQAYNGYLAELDSIGVRGEEAEVIAQALVDEDRSNAVMLAGVLSLLGSGTMTVAAPAASVVNRYRMDTDIGQRIIQLGNDGTLAEWASDIKGEDVPVPKTAHGVGRMYSDFAKNATKYAESAAQREDVDASVAYYNEMRNAGQGEGTTAAPASDAQMKAVREALERTVRGKKLTADQQKTVQGDKNLADTIAAYNDGDKIIPDRTTSERIKRRGEIAGWLTQVSFNKKGKNTTTQTGTSDEMAEKASAVHETMNVTDDGNTRVGDESVTSIKFKSLSEDGTSTVTVTTEDGNTREVSLDEVTFGDTRQSEVMAYASVMATPQLANQFVSMASTTDVALDQLSNGMNQAYDMALSGYKLDYVQRSALTEGLSSEQTAVAYNMGAGQKATNIAAEERRIAERQKMFSGKGWKGGKLSYGDVDYNSLDDRRKQQVDAMEMFAGVSGFNIELFESKANANGKYEGEQGQYIHSTNTIRIDINAGLSSQYDSVTQVAMLRTLSHELTHSIRSNNVKAYNDIKTAVLDVLAGQNFDIEARVDKIIDNDRRWRKLKGIEGKDMTREQALDEVVADACEMMLRNSDAVEQLAKNHPAEAKTLGQKILAILKRWRDAIAKVFGNAHSAEAKALAKAMNKDISRIEKMWRDALVKTAEVSGQELAARTIDLTADEQKKVNSEQAVSGVVEVKNSLRWDEKYFDAAEKLNKRYGFVDAQTMKDAQIARETVREFFRDPKNKELLKLPADETGKTFYANSSYSGSMENTTVCIRSMAAQQLMDAVAKDLGRPLTVQDTLFISQEIASLTEKPECFYCYVATDRRAYREYLGEYLKQRDDVISKYKAGADKETLYREFLDGRADTANMKDRFNMWIKAVDNGVELITPKDIASLEDMFREIDGKKKPKVGKLTTSRLNQLQDAAAYAQSASWAKKMVGYAAYNNQILKFSQKRVDGLNDGYGLRMYSFSDYSPAFILENMQMITDAAVRGLNVLAYTKEIDFAEIFAPTGANINVSVFAEEVNGQIQDGSMQGAKWEDAQKLRDAYGNVGIVMVATSDKIMKWAMEQDWIDVVIPYHLVRTGKQVAEYFGYKDYTSVSGDKKTDAYQKGDPTSISPVIHRNDIVSYVEALQRYHLTPRFAEEMQGYEEYLNGDITAQEFRDMNPYYMKLVNETRRSYGDTKPVQPIFNTKAAMASIDTMMKQGGYYQPIGGSIEGQNDLAATIADDIRNRDVQNDLREVTEDDVVNMSVEQIDRDYMRAVINGASDEQLMVYIDEIARRRGYTSGHVYHGTTSFGFTKFDPEFSDDKISLFVAEDFELAKSYSADYTKLRRTDYKPEYNGEQIKLMKGQRLADVYNKYNGEKMRPATNAEVVQLMRERVYKATDSLIPFLEDELAKLSRDSDEYKQLDQLIDDIDNFPGINVDKPSDFATSQEYESIRKRYLDLICNGDSRHWRAKNIHSLGQALKNNAEQLEGEEWFANDNKPNSELMYARQLQYNLFATASGGIYDLYMKYDPNEFFNVDFGRPFDWDHIPGEIIGRPDEYVNTRDVAKWAKKHGYAGAYFNLVRDSGGQLVKEKPDAEDFNQGSDVVVLFDGHYLKSADPVTYDDNHQPIPPSKRFDFSEHDIRYSQRDLDDVSDREILADYIESQMDTSSETAKQQLAEYRQKLEEYRAKAQEVPEYRRIVNELTEKAQGSANRARNMYDAIATLAEVSRGDLAMATKTDRVIRNLENLVKRNAYQQAALDKAYAKQKEIMLRTGMTEKEYLEWRYNRYVSDTSEQTVLTPEEQKQLNEARKKLASLSNRMHRLDGELMKLEGASTLRKIVDAERQRINDIASRRIERYKTTQKNKTTREVIDKKVKTLDTWLQKPKDDAYIPDKLRNATIDLLSIIKEANANPYEWRDEKPDRSESITAKRLERIERIKAAYNDARAEDNDGAYDEKILDDLEKIATLYNSKPFSKFNSDELAVVRGVVDHFTFLAKRDMANFREGKRETMNEFATRFKQQMDETGVRRKRKTLVGDFFQRIAENPTKAYKIGNMTPITFARSIGGAYEELVQDIFDAESEVGIELNKIHERMSAIKEKHGYNKWDFKQYREIVNAKGERLLLNLEEAMMLYATYQRQIKDKTQEAKHITEGGIVERHTDKVLRRKSDGSTSGKTLSEEDMKVVTDWLKEKPEYIAYINDMVDLLSKDIAEKLNAASVKLHGFSKFGKNFYFPYNVSSMHRSKGAAEAEAVLLKNWGSAKQTKKGANAPLELGEFTDIIDNHIETALNYAYVAVPQDNLNRLLNFKFDTSNSMENLMTDTYGEAAVKYIRTWIKDMYGAKTAPKTAIGRIADKGVARFKKSAVLFKASVWMQQYSAIYRAQAHVDMKYFYGEINNPSASWNELKKYAGTAVFKEIGGYDPNLGRKVSDWLGDKKPTNILDRLTDKVNFMPEAMDKLGWARIWNAVKREQAEKTGLDINSEKLLKIAGRRFDEVIRLTQVYDSVMSKSEYMRSKNPIDKAFTNFMGEPTQIVNMVLDAWEHRKEDPKQLWRTARSLIISSFMKNLALSLVHAAYGGDDEEDKFWERYVFAFFSNTVSDGQILSYLPFLSTAGDILQGFGSERNEMHVLTEITSGIRTLMSDTASEEDKAWAGIAIGGTLLNVPVQNLRKFWTGLANEAQYTFGKKERPDRDGAFFNAMKYGAADGSILLQALGVKDTRTYNIDNLYNAILDGDEEGIADYRKHILDYNDPKNGGEEKLNSDLRARIKTGYLDGDMDSDEAIGYLIDYCGMSDRDASDLVNDDWLYQKTTGNPRSKADEAYIESDMTHDEYEATLVEYGESDYDAATAASKATYKKVTGRDYDDMDDDYYNMVLDGMDVEEARAEYIAMKGDYGFMTPEQASKAFDKNVLYSVENDGLIYSEMERDYFDGVFGEPGSDAAHAEVARLRMKYGDEGDSAAGLKAGKWDYEKEFKHPFSKMEYFYLYAPEDERLDRNTVIANLQKYGGMSEADAHWEVEEWEFKADPKNAGKDWSEYKEFTRLHDSFTVVKIGDKPVTTAENRSAMTELYSNYDFKRTSRRSKIDSEITDYYGEMYYNTKDPKTREQILNQAMAMHDLNWEVCGEGEMGYKYRNNRRADIMEWQPE